MSEMFSQGEIDRIIEDSWHEWQEQEPCDDCISRQAALEIIKNLYPDMPVMDIMGARRKWRKKYAPYIACENAIEQLPSVTPQYTEAEIQKMQELEQAEIQKAYELGKAEHVTKINYCPICGHNFA